MLAKVAAFGLVKTESSTKEINTFEGMKVSHLALEIKTNSN